MIEGIIGFVIGVALTLVVGFAYFIYTAYKISEELK